jgi:aryl-alcohol dehydrogenase-like predicted oxidoreductase
MRPPDRIPLGRTGLFASAIGLGCSRLGSTLGGCTGPAALDLLQHALEAGVTLFDTADIYGQGDSERLLGQALRSGRDRAVIVTKAGQRFTAAQRAAALLKAPLRRAARALPRLSGAIAAHRAAPLPRDFRPDYLRGAAERSLRRLGTDRIDAFLLHSPSAEDIAAAAPAFAALEDMAAAGWIRCWGISCDDAAAARAALVLPGLGVLQLPLALAASAELAPSLATAARQGLGILVRGLSVAGRLAQPAARQHALSAALAVPGAVALVGTTRAEHLDEMLHAAAAQAGLPARPCPPGAEVAAP